MNQYLVQLQNNLFGTVTLDTYDPIGLDELESMVKRSDENDGVMHEITVELGYIKEAREFAKKVYDHFGIQGVINVTLYEGDPNTRKFEIYYTGKLQLTNYSITPTVLKTKIEQTGFQRKVLNLMDTDVDVETMESQGGQSLAATPTLDLTLVQKKINKALDATPTDGNEFAQIDVFEINVPNDILGGSVLREKLAYGQIDFSNTKVTELTETFQLPFGWVEIPGGGISNAPVLPPAYITYLQNHIDPRNEFYRAKEAGVADVDLKLALKHSVYSRNDGGDVDICGEGSLGNVEVNAFFEKRNQANVIQQITHIGSWDMAGCGGDSRIGDFETKIYQQDNINVAVGDKLYVYLVYRVYGEYDQPTGTQDGHVWHEFRVEADPDNTFLKVTTATVFPESQAKAVMIYEALNKTAEYITDQKDALKSDFFGRTDSIVPYLVNGRGSQMAITNGRNIRGVDNKTIFTNLKDLIQSLHTCWHLGFGFETIGGVQKLVVEPKSHFYNKNNLILEFGPVNELEKIVDFKRYWTQVEIGFPKVDAGQVNGIDEYNTVRRFAAPLTEAKTKALLKSTYRASGYEIEAIRRLAGTTKDNKQDDDNFFICVYKDGPNYVVETNQNFPVINNVFDPGGSYNLDISPTRCFKRHGQTYASTLWPPAQTNKKYKFTYGEINYLMSSRRFDEFAAIIEGADVDFAGVEPLFYPEIYKFTHELRRQQMKLIRQNPYGFIRFKDDLLNVHDGYIVQVKHKANENVGEFDLLRVFRNI